MSKKATITTILLAMTLGVSILFTGCLGLQLTDNQEFAVTKMARIAGITMGLEEPGEIDKALSYIAYVSGLEDANIKEAAIDAAVAYIYTRYGKTNKTVIIVAEVIDLVRVIVPGDVAGGLDKIDMKLLNLALDGFKDGLELAR